MYNWVGCSRELAREVLEFQTEQYLKSDRTDSDLLKLKPEIFSRRPKILYPVIYNCEFLGFIGNGQKRVGCLLHPGLNNGNNLRGISHHGRETCDQARCTAYFYLSEGEAELAASAAADWYLYGLCLTDLDLVKEFFKMASGMVFQEVRPETIGKDPKLLEIFQRYLGLKESWKWARNPLRFGKYIFQEGKYLIHRIDYSALGRGRSRHDKILNSLGSEFENAAELHEAEAALENLLQEFAGKFR